MMDINVRVFGGVKDIVGSDRILLRVPESGTTGDLLRMLVTRFPELEAWKNSIRVAVNQDYMSEEVPVSPDDEVAIIPPVSGG